MNEQERVWLNRLLNLEQERQGRELQRLAVAQPELHARITELLADAAANSQELMQPVLNALDNIVQSSMVVHRPGHVLAGYRLLREIGQGGMSVVWLAERMDGMIKRTVALKLPLYALTSPADIARFSREKDVLANLTHPNIARLYDAGISNCGQPFLVLEYVEGLPITEYCDHHRLGIRQRFELFLQALAAVDDAHQHLIVHLDLKPSNILVDGKGQVKLLDFGISRLMNESTPDPLGASLQPTPSERVIGMAMTVRYAAPEQVCGHLPSILTDVYALGVLLHELLTGTSPYPHEGESHSIATLLKSITAGHCIRPSRAPVDKMRASFCSLPSPRRLRATLRGEIDAIVGKAMAAEPAKRYRSIERFSSDVRRLLLHRPIAARPRNILRSSLLFVRRHCWISSAICVTALSTALAVSQTQLARTQQTRAEGLRSFMTEMWSTTGTVAEREIPAILQDLRRLAAPKVYSTASLDEPALVAAIKNGWGPRSPQYALALSRLGTLRVLQGDWLPGRQMLAEALQLTRETMGSDSVPVAEILEQMSDLKISRDDYAAASSLNLEAIAIYRERGQPALLRALGNQAEIYARWGHTAEASATSRLLERQLLFSNDELNDLRRQRFDIKLSLAKVRLAEGSFAEAEDLARAALDLVDRVPRDEGRPIDIVFAAFARTMVGIALLRQAKTAEAEEHLRESLAIYNHALPEPSNHPYVASSQHYLGEVFLRQQRLSEGNTTLQRAIQCWSRSNSPAWRIWRSKSLLGEALYRQGSITEGAVLMRDSCRSLKNDREADFSSKAEAAARLLTVAGQNC